MKEALKLTHGQYGSRSGRREKKQYWSFVECCSGVHMRRKWNAKNNRINWNFSLFLHLFSARRVQSCSLFTLNRRWEKTEKKEWFRCDNEKHTLCRAHEEHGQWRRRQSIIWHHFQFHSAAAVFRHCWLVKVKPFTALHIVCKKNKQKRAHTHRHERTRATSSVADTRTHGRCAHDMCGRRMKLTQNKYPI